MRRASGEREVQEAERDRTSTGGAGLALLRALASSASELVNSEEAASAGVCREAASYSHTGIGAVSSKDILIQRVTANGMDGELRLGEGAFLMVQLKDLATRLQLGR